MTLKDLEQIIYMKSEIDVLTKRLNKAKGDNYVADHAKDYSTGYERIITIRGYAITDTNKVNKISLMLETRKQELEERVLEAENFIASIPDSKIRTILTLRFLEGKNWGDVVKSLYKKMSGNSARMCVIRYFENI